MKKFKYQFTPRMQLNRIAGLVDCLWLEGYLLNEQEAVDLAARFKAQSMPLPKSIAAALPKKRDRGRPQKRLTFDQYREISQARDFRIRKLVAGVRYDDAMHELTQKFRYGGRFASVKHWEDAFARRNREPDWLIWRARLEPETDQKAAYDHSAYETSK